MTALLEGVFQLSGDYASQSNWESLCQSAEGESTQLEEEEQCDFCPRHGTVGQLFTLARILERAWEIAYQVYMCFVDLEKAYDRVPQGVLWEAQQQYGVPVPLTCAIQSLYNRCESRVLLLVVSQACSQ